MTLLAGAGSLRRMTRCFLLLELLIAALLWTHPAPAAASEDSEPTAEDVRVAAERFDAGRDAFKAGNYIEAAEHFEAADTSAPSAVSLGLAMRSRKEAGQVARAATLAALVLLRYPDESELCAQANDILAEADAELARIQIRCDQECDILVDRKIVHGRPARSHTVYVNPGSREIQASWGEGADVTKTVQAEAGARSDVDFERPEPDNTQEVVDKNFDALAQEAAEPLPEEPKPEERHGWSPTVFYIGAGLTVAAGAATAWSGYDTLNNPGKDKVREECVGLGTDCPAYKQGQRNELRTNILAGVTAAFGIATVVVGLVATDWQGKEPERDRNAESFGGLRSVRPYAAVLPELGPDGSTRAGAHALTAAVGATGRF